MNRYYGIFSEHNATVAVTKSLCPVSIIVSAHRVVVTRNEISSNSELHLFDSCRIDSMNRQNQRSWPQSIKLFPGLPNQLKRIYVQGENWVSITVQPTNCLNRNATEKYIIARSVVISGSHESGSPHSLRSTIFVRKLPFFILFKSSFLL